ncbi:MotA/TolQ/ExbB proton channel family protein [Marinobacterium sediminicola]|uniref:Outer membrane transport energization protein ExbB n=1 Tax=Marinobacterium sediminicola TaxID=518898 RepID=A0ABY1RXX7_9GAMM|nr:MotA/TolQ/ExbB proton channel family protein [Marinobacterium sediminicola]ULG68641.1 MotA/TolQ/ExbB proton channel family protein [Marinobacterium sediminicola]SMR73164.1 outer membrane transport energization protein ExbB [Marinobacterium sediminicola]
MMVLTRTLTVLLLVISMPTQANELQQLLQQVRSQAASDHQVDTVRLAEFRSGHARQQALLEQAKARLAKAEDEQTRLKEQFQSNEDALTSQGKTLRVRTGQLGEVFGVVKQQAQELKGLVDDSMISAQYPERAELLAFADLKRIPTLNEMEGLWFLLQQEMTATGEVIRFTAPVIQANGVRGDMEVLRIGPFTALTQQGHYLKFAGDQLQVLPVQPAGKVVDQARAFVQGQGEALVVDPSRGNLLALLSQTPNLKERIAQGGLVGYIILALGGIGLLVALWKLLTTLKIELSVRAQLRNGDEACERNPLGRVLAAGQAGRTSDETELRVDEALLKEAPLLERGLTLLKLVAAVAPLLGLLGTVTGMIGTFQSITLFGTGDPKLMAGGISQALMTTVLGLCVAIPLLFCHSLLAARSRRLLQLLQQKGLALLATQREQLSDAEEARHAA